MRFVGKLLGYGLLLVVSLIGGTLLAARFANGPLEIVAGGGGPFTTGELVAEEADLALLKDYDTVELQLLNPEGSRTTWVAVHDGRVFIPCGYMTTWWGKLWKRWPLQLENDPRALLRVDGRIYPLRLERILHDPAVAPVLAELGRKYGQGEAFPQEIFDSGYLWIFELVGRSNARGEEA